MKEVYGEYEGEVQGQYDGGMNVIKRKYRCGVQRESGGNIEGIENRYRRDIGGI